MRRMADEFFLKYNGHSPAILLISPKDLQYLVIANEVKQSQEKKIIIDIELLNL